MLFTKSKFKIVNVVTFMLLSIYTSLNCHFAMQNHTELYDIEPSMRIAQRSVNVFKDGATTLIRRY